MSHDVPPKLNHHRLRARLRDVEVALLNRTLAEERQLVWMTVGHVLA